MNNNNLFMESKHYKIVMDILQKYPYTFYAFGSRVRGDQKQFSDLDLAYDEEIPWRDLVRIETDFEESDLPFKVDIIDLKKSKKEFLDMIAPDLIKITPSHESTVD